MKKLHQLLLLCSGVFFFALADNSKAAVIYFDNNGAGAGGTPTSGVWDTTTSLWTTTSGGVVSGSRVPWVQGDAAVFGAGSGTVASVTVTVNGPISLAGIFDNGVAGSVVTTLTISPGTGSLTLASGLDSFLVSSGRTETINASMGGPGQLNPQSSGFLNLYASNSYSGGTLLNNTSTLLQFNNNNSFGTGTITVQNASGVAPFLATGGSAITLSNNFLNAGTGGGLNFGSAANTPVICTGGWNLGTNTLIIKNNGNSTAPLTLAGALTGSAGGAATFQANSGGTILLTGTNTYTGATILGPGTGTGNVILEIGATGSIASTIVSNVATLGATLKLDSANGLNTNTLLQLPASPGAGSVNLNFTGTQSIAGIFLGGVVQNGGTYGAVGSGAQNTSATFTGTGILSTPAAPSFVSQPQSVGALDGGTATFSVVAAGASPLTYQWFSNNVAVGGNSPTFTFSPVTASSVGNFYYVNVSNSAGNSNSQTVSLTLIPSNSYTAAIQANNPLAYWRLDETSGTVALDSISTNNGTYINVTLGQTGYSLTDPDTAIGLPTATNTRGYVVVSNSAAKFNFTSGNSAFTFEGWAFFTNLNGVQRLFSTLDLGHGYAFGINGARGLRFTQGSVQDVDFILPHPLVVGTWYHLAVTCDGFSTYFFYVNGVRVGSVAIGGVGVPNNGVGNPAVQGLQMGANPPAYFVSSTDLSEQVRGNLDEMAVYGGQLSDGDIANHFAARYATPHVPVVLTPLLEPATNYVSLSTTIASVAGGPSLTYQWFLAPSTPISGATDSAYTIPSVQLSDSGSTFYVMVSNGQGTSNSPISGAITVLPIPTNAADLNLTNNLVMHLTFDGTYADATARGNNGTNVGATSFVTPGIVGSNALHYSSAPGDFNYVNIGVRPDLQFGSNVNFSVSFWVRETNGSVITNLPFFADTTNGSGAGFEFTPYATSTTSGGGWQWDLSTVSSPNQFTPALIASDVNLLNDGNWHHLAFVTDRSANLTTYLDGSQVDSQAINFLGNINTTTAAVVGQDSSGAYAVTAAADIDDLGVWRRTLSDLEVSGIYLAGISNNVSFAATAVVPVNLSITNVSGTLEVIWAGPGTLQATTNLLGTNTVYTNVVGAASPYPVPTPQNTATFYRLKY